MKAKSTLALIAVAGCACTVASAQMSFNNKAVKVAPKWQPVQSAPLTATIAKDAPTIISMTRLTTGETVYFPQNDPGNADRIDNAFDSYNDPDAGSWNIPWVNGAGYSGGGGSIYLFPWSEDPNCLVFGGSWTGGTSAITGNVTDVIFNTYAADDGIWPGALSDINNVSQMQFAITNCNTEVVGGISDFRTNEFAVLFFDVNDTFVDGFNFTQALSPDECFIWLFTLDLSTIGGIDIPGEGTMVFDNLGALPPATSGDCGFGVNPQGGFIIGFFGTNPAPVGNDLVAIPDGDSQVIAADQAGYRDFLDTNWFYQATADLDPCLDGNCADSTYTDLLLGPNAVNWSFTLPSGDGAAAYESPHGMPFALGGDFAPTTCEADLSGSLNPNDPGFGVPDGITDGVDFFFFLSLFSAGDLAADVTGSIDPNNASFGVPDGLLDGSDFFYYLALFECCNGDTPSIPVVCSP